MQTFASNDSQFAKVKYCILQFSFLAFQAILLFSPQSSLLQKLTRDTKIFIHWVLSVSAATCMIIGGWVIYHNKEANNKPHLRSWHGLLGFITIIYFIVQLFGGIANKYSASLSTVIDSKYMRFMHAVSGMLLFLFLTGTVVLGMYSNWFTGVVTGTSFYACVLCPIIIALVVCNQVVSKYFINKHK